MCSRACDVFLLCCAVGGVVCDLSLDDAVDDDVGDFIWGQLLLTKVCCVSFVVSTSPSPAPLPWCHLQEACCNGLIVPLGRLLFAD